MADEQPPDFFLEIEAHFAYRRGTPFIFSAKDFALLKEWETEGIPLAVVLEAIDTCFESRAKSGRKSPISSLSYCRHAVKDLWSQRKELQVGSAEALPELDAAAQLSELSSMVRSAASELSGGSFGPVLERSAEAIASLGARHSIPEIEGRLLELEGQLVDEILAAMPESDRKSLLDRIDAELGAYRIPNEEVRRKTREANLRRAVRRLAGIPRLSLFG